MDNWPWLKGCNQGLGGLLCIGLTIGQSLSTTLAQETPPITLESPQPPLRPPLACPADLETVANLLARDLPSYANRVLQRSIGEVRRDLSTPALASYRPTYIVIASQPDLTPLEISQFFYTTDPTAGANLSQVFLTTLERQYNGSQITELHQFHWLFLTPDTDGWRLAFLFSALQNSASNTPLSPPRDSSQSDIGRAIQLWLKDCRVGAIDGE